MKKHQGIPQHLRLLFGHQQLPMGAADHPLEAARGQPVAGETLLFQRHQRRQVLEGCSAKDKIHMTAVKVA